MEKHYWRIDVPGSQGYSFAIKSNDTTESDAIESASDAGLFDDPRDCNYASAEDITDDDYEMSHWSKDATVIP